MGRKSPNLRTLLRLADAAGLRLVVSFVPIEDAERHGHHAWTTDPARAGTLGGPMRVAQRERGSSEDPSKLSPHHLKIWL